LVDRFLADEVLPARGAWARVMSLTREFCCFRISAAHKPRAAPAQALAPLNHRLNQGFFIAVLSSKRANVSGCSGFPPVLQAETARPPAFAAP
jgi:hypothetical protein